MTIDDARRVWDACLSELHLRVTQREFDTWLRGSHALATDNGRLTVYVRHAYAADWLAGPLMATIRPIAVRAGLHPDAEITFITRLQPLAAPIDDEPAGDDPAPAAPAGAPDLRAIAEYNPNTKSSGGFSIVGNYATTYWGALLGSVTWRCYTIILAADKRRDKGVWTTPAYRTVSSLAHLVASGRAGRPNRNQITGRWREAAGDRVWIGGAFDTLTAERVGRVEWRSADCGWQRWQLAGAGRASHRGQRLMYRVSVLVALPLLTPSQVARLAGDLQIQHAHYLAERGIDLELWEQIQAATLAPANLTVITAADAAVTCAPGAVARPVSFFGPPTAPLDDE